MTFEVGSVVVLNTGAGPVMTVICIDENAPLASTRTMWFNGTWPTYEVRTAWFPSACLRAHDETEQPSPR